ncbi:PAS domain S-box protein [Halorientalis salina]|uniref:PAS domain S-box protein n=1 Tax=Halorientalis salina TaxID=2932266 RepID=UPI0010AC1671|nr:PAS domain S-box protein [Halorientalis salina]
MTKSDSRETLRSNVLNRVSDAIVSLNSDLEYTFANPRAEQLLDATEESLRGTYIRDAFPEVADTVAEQQISEALETGQEQTFERYNEALDRWFEVRVYPDEDGVSVFFTHISERKERGLDLERYEQAIEALPVAVGINTPGEEGRFEFVNQAAVDMLGASSKSELQDHAPGDTYANPDERKRFSEQLRETGSVEQYEVQLTTLEGETFWGSMTANLTEIGGAEYIIGIIEDVSERKQRVQELEAKTRAIEAAPIGVSLSNPQQDDNPLTYVNERFEEITGYAAEEIRGRNCRFLQGETTDEEPVSAMRDAIAAEESVTVELRNYRKDGEQFWNRVSIAPVQTENGPSHFVGFQQDITEEKQREQELKENKEQIAEQNDALKSFAKIVTNAERTLNQRITDLLNLGATYLDLDVGILSEIDGSEYTVRDVVGPAEAIEPGDSLNLTDTYCSLVYEADGPVSFHSSDDGGVKDHPAYQNKGMESYIGVPVFVDDHRYGTLNFSRPESREAPITDAEESLVRIMAQWVGTELTRQQRQEELERTSQFLKDTQEVAKVGGWEVSLQSERMRWSEELYRIHELPLDANPTPEEGIEFYHPDDRDTIREAFDRLTTEGEPYDLELRIVRTDDNVRWVRTRGEPIYEDDEIVAVHGTFQDITERKESQKELEKSKQVIESSTDIATIIDSRGTITYVSPAVEDVLGYEPEELIGTDGFGYQPDETKTAVAAAIEHVMETPAETKTVQTRFRRADGSWCWIESTLRSRLNDDVIGGILVSSRDITERKEWEQELQRQNSRLNEFASVISHDLRNPLNVAQSRATILQERTDDEFQEHLAPLLNSLERMESIIEDTLTLARQGETIGEMSSIPVMDLVGKCWAGVETAEATLEIDDEFTIRGDRDRLRHVFENLFRNAVEHGVEDVTVRVGRAGEDCIYVEDDGPGILPDDRDKVFEPGHTSATGGTGFGLTIVKRIAEAHGWEVTVTDGGDGGARFEFDTAGLIGE